MATFYIIDGYAQFFRCYHAIRTPMTSPVTKEPTNMTFGFVGMLLKLLKGEGAAMKAWGGAPTYVVVALDVGGDRGTFRSQIYPEYKATRSEPPEDLGPQVERCLGLLKEVGVPVIGMEGFEADDVCATLVTKLQQQHPEISIRMVSKDKDLKQLLHNGNAGAVELFDVHTDTAFTVETLLSDTGLRPDQVVDMLTLMGDTSDNVPGVDGVGEKTAALLMKEYGSLDGLVARAAEVKGKRGEKLREAIPRLPLTKELITLRRDLDVPVDLEAARVDRLRLEKLIPACKELGFNRYQDEARVVMKQLGMGAGKGAEVGQGENKPREMPVSLFNTPAPEPEQRSLAKPAKKSGGSAGNEGIAGGLFEAADAPRSVQQAQSGEYRCIATLKELREFIAAAKKAAVLAVDTETTSLSPRDAKLCGISMSIATGTGVYVPMRSPTPDKHLGTEAVLTELRPLLEDPGVAKCGHNLKYDLLIFRAHGVTLRGVAFDSMVSSYLIDASRSSHSLDALALALLGRTNISLHDLLGSGKDMRTFDTLGLEQAVQYAAEDADVAMQLRAVMLPQLRSMELMPLFERVEMPLVEVLADLEWNGIAVDAKELDRQRERLQKQIDGLLERINAEAKKAIGRTFDPDSPKQLAAALFNKPDDLDAPGGPGLGIKGTKKTKTGWSTDAEVLEDLASDERITTPIPTLILEYRQLTKLVSTYLVALKEAIHPQTGRIHSSFHQTVAATGRLASSDPNLQNIPIRTDVGREIRRAFVAPAGRVLVSADYSQIELRLLAHLSRDPALIDAFHHDADIHTAVAAQIANKDPKDVTREERSGAKMVNFGIVYGITAYGLARRLKIDDKRAAEIITNYKKKFAGITTFLQECVDQAKAKGYVTTILGRRRPIPDIESTNPSRRALAERLAINTVVQGSAADLIKVAMVGIRGATGDAGEQMAKGPKGHMAKEAVGGSNGAFGNLAIWQFGPLPPPPPFLTLLQIHDELVFECQEQDAESVRRFVVAHMEGAMRLAVPLKVDSHVSANWFDGK
jgi:DNA polymerase-1